MSLMTQLLVRIIFLKNIAYIFSDNETIFNLVRDNFLNIWTPLLVTVFHNEVLHNKRLGR